MEVIARVNSYTEVSPSGTGVKMFLRYVTASTAALRHVMGTDHGKQFRRGKGEHPPAIELHISRRYFAVTGQHLAATPEELRLVDLSTIIWLLTEGGPVFVRGAADQAGLEESRTADEVASACPAGKQSSKSELVTHVDALLIRLDTAMGCKSTLAERWKGSAAGLQDTSRSGMDMSMTALLKRAGFAYKDTKALLLRWQHGAGAEHAGNDRYFHRMWNRVTAPEADAGVQQQPDPKAGTAKTIWLFIGSDAEIATRVTDDLRGQFGPLVYCDGAIWRYEPTHWSTIPEESLWLAATRYDGAMFKTPGGENSRVRLNKTRVESILACMRPALTRREFFGAAAIGINCMSGFIRFNDDGQPTLKAHSPDHRCRHVLPGRWPIGFSDEQKKHSLLGQLLEGCFKDDEDKRAKIDLIGEVAGVAALGCATKLAVPKALVLKGETADNGKSQLLDVLRALLPGSAVSSISPAKFKDRTFACHLPGKLLNAPDELASGDAIASDAFKQVITGEPMMSRDLYERAFEFRPVAQHVYATNNLPTFKGGMDRGVRRRLMVLTFNRIIPVNERIKQIGLRVGAEEADLLLDWAVRNASRVIAKQVFTEPASSVDALRDWMFSSDPVLSWLESDEVAFGKSDCPPETRTNIAFDMFRRWAIDQGYSGDKLPVINGFSQRVLAAAADRGVTKKRTAAGAIFVGLACTGAGSQDRGRSWPR